MNVRIANPEDMHQVYRLTHDMYVGAGYIEPQPDGVYRHYPHLDGIPETTVFVAERDDLIVGTNSLTVDGPHKLHVDEDFPEEVEAIRHECASTNKNLGASWRMSTSPELRNSTMVVMELITATMESMGQQHVNLMLSSLNPKHEGFYKRLLGLETVAWGECACVTAPGVLMRGDTISMSCAWQEVCKRRKMPYEPHIVS